LKRVAEVGSLPALSTQVWGSVPMLVKLTVTVYPRVTFSVGPGEVRLPLVSENP
jgi:hypothetical protein